MANAANSLPRFAWGLFPVSAYATLACATVAFLIAFWWLWQIVRPRDYDYPPDDGAVARYAAEMTVVLANFIEDADELEERVLRELRLYMASAFSTVTRSTFAYNHRQLSARSQVLVFLLCGFLLAFMCEAIIYGHAAIVGPIPQE